MSRVVRRPNSRIKNVKKKGERARDLSNSGSSSVLSFSNKVSRLSSPYGTSVNFHSQSHLFKKHIKAPNPLIGSLTLSKSSDKDLRNSFQHGSKQAAQVLRQNSKIDTLSTQEDSYKTVSRFKLLEREMNEKLSKIEPGDKRGKFFIVRDFFQRYVERTIDGQDILRQIKKTYDSWVNYQSNVIKTKETQIKKSEENFYVENRKFEQLQKRFKKLGRENTELSRLLEEFRQISARDEVKELLSENRVLIDNTYQLKCIIQRLKDREKDFRKYLKLLEDQNISIKRIFDESKDLQKSANYKHYKGHPSVPKLNFSSFKLPSEKIGIGFMFDGWQDSQESQISSIKEFAPFPSETSDIL